MINLPSRLIDGYFTKLFRPIYIAASSKEHDMEVIISSALKDYIDLINSKTERKLIPRYMDSSFVPAKLTKNKKVMIAFSGGKDSIAAVTKFLEKGYEVYLYNLNGINRSYIKETEYSEKIANYLGLEFVSERISISGKCDYIENPTRNQFILAMMVDCGLKQNIYRYAFGNMRCDTIANTQADIMNSDSLELFDCMEKYYQTFIPNFRLFTVLRDGTDSYCQIAKYDSGLFRFMSSCNGPHRFKESRKVQKEEKFGMHLLPYRCGTCYKCANEAIVLNMLGVMQYPDEYISYCHDVLNKWTHQLHTEEVQWFDEEYIRKFRAKYGEFEKLEV